MSNLIALPIRDENIYQISNKYKNQNSEVKWTNKNEKVISHENGYSSTKLVNTEYKLKEREGKKEIKEEEVCSDMDNDKLLEKYMDSVNRNIKDMDRRNIEDKREREQRIERNQMLSEERMEKRFIEAMEAIRNQNNIIDSALDKIDSKYENLKWWILGTAVAIILSIMTIILSIK